MVTDLRTFTRWRIRQSTALVVAALALMTAWTTTSLAAFTCTAEVNRKTVPQGEEVVLTVSAKGDVGWSPEFKLPDMPGIQVYGGGTNQSMSVVNGRAETAVSRTYYLRVSATDDFTIGPVQITGNGGNCATAPIAIKVTAAKPSVPPADTGNRVQAPAPGTQGTTAVPGNAAEDEIFVTLEVDQDDVWVGQQVILTFRYWRRVQPWNNPSYKAPRTEGFWREDLGAERNFRKVRQGRAFNVTEINYALFPTRSGELIIEPAELSFPEDLFNRFFNSRSQRRGPRLLRTDPVKVIVRELPSPTPDGFSGIVASRLDLHATVDRDTVPRGEAVGVLLNLVADGFLKGFRGLALPAMENARVHDAAESFSSGGVDSRLISYVKLEKVVVPSQEGGLRLPQVELSWFDTVRGAYRTARTPWRDIVVTPSDSPQVGTDESGFLRSEISRLGEDLGFIHPAPTRLGHRLRPWTGSALWWALLVAPAVLLAVWRVVLHRLSAARRDPAGMRRRRALVVARRELTQSLAREDAAARMSGFARAITGFVADRVDLPLAAVDAEAVREHGRACGLATAGEELADILAQCDVARFGGGEVDGGEELVRRIETHLTQLARAGARQSATGRLATLTMLAGLGLGTLVAVTPVRAAAETARPGVDPVRLMAEGNQAYTEGRVDDARDLYLTARDLGVNDAVLHFNLGNAQARTGELGRAVASYLRAKRLAPRDADVKRNLAWVRRNLKDLELVDEPLPLFIAQVAAVVGYLSLDEWGAVLVILGWCLAILVAWTWWRGLVGTGQRRALLAVGGLVVVAGAIVAGRWYQERIRDLGVVVVHQAEVRSGPAENFPVLFEVHDGLTVNLEGRRDDWVRIGMGGEWVGWLPAASVESVRRGSSLMNHPG